MGGVPAVEKHAAQIQIQIMKEIKEMNKIKHTFMLMCK